MAPTKVFILDQSLRHPSLDYVRCIAFAFIIFLTHENRLQWADLLVLVRVRASHSSVWSESVISRNGLPSCPACEFVQLL